MDRLGRPIGGKRVLCAAVAASSGFPESYENNRDIFQRWCSARGMTRVDDAVSSPEDLQHRTD